MTMADPKTITISTVGHDLVKIGSPTPYSSVYTDEDGNFKMTVSHRYGKRKSSLIRLDVRKVAADPLVNGNVSLSDSISLIFDRPLTGFTVAELKLQFDALTAHFAATGWAELSKFLAGEN